MRIWIHRASRIRTRPCRIMLANPHAAQQAGRRLRNRCSAMRRRARRIGCRRLRVPRRMRAALSRAGLNPARFRQPATRRITAKHRRTTTRAPIHRRRITSGRHRCVNPHAPRHSNTSNAKRHNVLLRLSSISNARLHKCSSVLLRRKSSSSAKLRKCSSVRLLRSKSSNSAKLRKCSSATYRRRRCARHRRHALRRRPKTRRMTTTRSTAAAERPLQAPAKRPARPGAFLPICSAIRRSTLRAGRGCR